MSDYISKAEAIEWLKDVKDAGCVDKYSDAIRRDHFDEAIETIESMPTVDAVPVVRCKDCKYYQQGRNADEWLWCMMNHHYTDEKKYCAWAEMKEE